MRAANGVGPADLVGNLELAYAVQEQLVARWRDHTEDTLWGYKLGMTTAEMQRRTGLREPASGMLLARRIVDSGAVLAAQHFVHLGLEGEIAVRIGAPFPETEPVDAATARRRLDRAAAAFEITDDRHADWSQMEGATMIADNIWNMGVVLGPPATLQDGDGLTGRRGVITIGDEVHDCGVSDDSEWDPAAIVAWLGAHLARRRQPLHVGQWIMTGSFVPTTFPKQGDRYRFDVDGLEPVEVTIA